MMFLVLFTIIVNMGNSITSFVTDETKADQYVINLVFALFSVIPQRFKVFKINFYGGKCQK